VAEVGDGRFTLTRGAALVPDAVIDTSATVFRGLIFGAGTLAAAEDAGLVTVRGYREAAARLLTLFPRPRIETAPAP
jgi:hypothetical protein